MLTISPLNTALLADLGAVRVILDAVPSPVFVKDAQHRFVVVNRAMCDLLGRTHEQLIGRTDADFVPEEQAEIFRANDKLVLDTGQVNENEEPFTDGEGVVRTIVTRKQRIELKSGARLIIGCIADITALRRAEDLIRYNAEHDHLTGLSNRLQFHRRLAEAIADGDDQGARATLLLVDLDGFKSVNDAFGHAVGDDVLVQAAGIISSLIGPGDFVARLGGDEFAIIQRAGDQPRAAVALAEKIIGRLSQPIFLGRMQASVSASVGIADVAVGAGDAGILLRRADLALYGAKKDGRNTWRLFEAGMESSRLMTRFLEEDLRQAVERQELSLVYQPFVRAHDLEVLGFEALMRWRHPRRGPLEPSLFIPLAERTGLIAMLGEWALRQACLDARSWPKPLRVSVNVSPVQFAQVDLAELVRGTIRDTGIDPHRIDIEITETAIIKDIAGAARVFASLRKLGVNVVLDDFGAGYSSLQILKSLPFDKIKIDRGLLQDVGRTAAADAIIGAILQLSRTLDLRVSAEGVETEEQLAILRRERCDELQGFLIGPAIPMAEQAVLVGNPAKRSA